MILRYLLFDQTIFCKTDTVIVNGGQQTADQPACGVAQSDGDHFITELRHNKQIDLPKRHEGQKHNDHGCFAVAGTPQGTGIDLIKAAKHVEGAEPPQEQCSVLDHFRLVVQESDDMGRKDQHGDHQQNGCGNAHEHGAGNALFCSFHLLAAQVLTDKSRNSQRN